jgi:hypothetical protein
MLSASLCLSSSGGFFFVFCGSRGKSFTSVCLQRILFLSAPLHSHTIPGKAVKIIKLARSSKKLDLDLTSLQFYLIPTYSELRTEIYQKIEFDSRVPHYIGTKFCWQKMLFRIEQFEYSARDNSTQAIFRLMGRPRTSNEDVVAIFRVKHFGRS